jgi:polysaccharide deacetylase family protein (PEP-CTERM system associated)
MKNALTFDLEEYFHAEAFAGRVRPEEWPSLESRVVRSTERVLSVLGRAGVRATFFVLGWVAERQPDLVREIASLGHEIASHGHAHRMIHRCTRREFADDVTRAKGVLEDMVGRAVVGYRAPTFSVVQDTLWSLEILARAGFRWDSSIFPIVHDRYGIPDAPRFPHRRVTASGQEIIEFPPSTVEVLGRRVPVAGGGYFRLAPYQLTRWAIRHLNERERQPALIYLHPWELDPAQPRLPAGPFTRFRHLVNVGRTEARLARLLQEVEVGPVGEILAAAGLSPVGDRS